MTIISNLIISYLKNNHKNLHGQIIKTVDDKCIRINFFYNYYDVTVLIYNENFIKLKIDNIPYAICDGIKTFRDEIDRLHTRRYHE